MQSYKGTAFTSSPPSPDRDPKVGEWNINDLSVECSSTDENEP